MKNQFYNNDLTCARYLYNHMITFNNRFQMLLIQLFDLTKTGTLIRCIIVWLPILIWRKCTAGRINKIVLAEKCFLTEFLKYLRRKLQSFCILKKVILDLF